MAAYAALASLINLMEDIQNHSLVSTFFNHEKLQSLGQNLDFLLKFVERSNSVRQRREVEDLERRIASEVHAAEDVIESYIVDRIQSGSTGDEVEDVKSSLQNATEALESIKKSIVGIETERGFTDQLPEYSSTRSYSSSKTVGFDDESIQLMERLLHGDSVKKSIMEIETERGFRDELPQYSPSRSDRSSKTTAVGLNDESFQLIERLINEEPNRQVIPIVGMGGSGKTTLARLVYEHSLMADRFDIRMWVSISQQYRVESILSELVYGGKNPTTQTVAELGENLHKKLYGRRYLIVLDDMWNIEAWNEIQLFLPDNGCGDRVVITTRLSNMAALLSSSPFEMKLLDEEKGWRLFCAKVFGEEECPQELEETGKDIVRKCKGLALSIVVIGGRLRKSSRMKHYWERVGNDINSVLDSEEDQCMSILSLSYNHLPAHLKPCFLYMGVFKEDEDVYDTRLINLWVAEGLIKANEERSKVEIAEECLRDLIDRNLILVHTWYRTGKNYFYKIHDLLRELIVRVAKKENFFIVIDTTQTIDRERRVVIRKNIETQIMIHAPPLVRSLKYGGSQLSSKFMLLRVVIDRVEVVLNGGLSERDFQNVNLRYLDCHFVQPKNAALEGYLRPTLHLPPSISLMWNLQILKISGEYDKIVAPAEIWKMSQLRRLNAHRLCLPNPPSMDDPILQNLLQLEAVENLSLSDDVCRIIPNVKRLNLIYDFSRKSDEASMYYYLHNLGCFHKLESLSCSLSGKPKWYHFARDLTFPKSFHELLRCTFPRKPSWYNFARDLTYPSSLQWLCLIDFPLRWDDLTMIGSLPHLVDLKLWTSVRGSKWNPVEMGFRSLRSLMISGCCSLVSWNAESCHFPVLEYLHLTRASKLDEIPSSIGDIPTLKHISLLYCSDSAAVSAARILVEQQELGNDGLRVEVKFKNRKKLQSLREMLGKEGLTCNNLDLWV